MLEKSPPMPVDFSLFKCVFSSVVSDSYRLSDTDALELLQPLSQCFLQCFLSGPQCCQHVLLGCLGTVRFLRACAARKTRVSLGQSSSGTGTTRVRARLESLSFEPRNCGGVLRLERAPAMPRRMFTGKRMERFDKVTEFVVCASLKEGAD